MADKKMYVPVILGTARKERASEKVAQFVLAQAGLYGFETELVDVRDYLYGETIPPWVKDERSTPWKNIAARADGFIIVCPEYNHGYAGELKILLDSAYTEYEKKPIGLCGVSSGVLRGARGVENLRQVLIALRSVPINNAVYFGNVAGLFEGDTLKDPEFYEKKAKGMFDQLASYIPSKG